MCRRVLSFFRRTYRKRRGFFYFLPYEFLEGVNFVYNLWWAPKKRSVIFFYYCYLEFTGFRNFIFTCLWILIKDMRNNCGAGGENRRERGLWCFFSYLFLAKLDLDLWGDVECEFKHFSKYFFLEERRRYCNLFSFAVYFRDWQKVGF